MSTWLGRPSQRRDPRGSSRAARGSGRSRRLALRILAITGISIVGLAIVAALGFYIVLNGLTNPVHLDSLAEVVPGARVNILVMGLDAPLDSNLHAIPNFDIHKSQGSRTDTMMLFSIDPDAGQVSLLSLPRDSRVIISGREDYGYDKLGHANAYGGADMLVATVSKLLNVPIHYYIRVNSAGVAKIIDTLGGVEIYVESNMNYEDPYQDFQVHLQKGLQTLNGEQAVGYLRYRPGSDIDRITRQQKFISALKDQLFSLGTIAKLPALLSQVSDTMDTNMTAAEMLSYTRMAAKLSSVTVTTATLPGEIATVQDPGREPLSYWRLHDDEIRTVVDSLLWGVDPQANASISVEVQNGTTTPDLAARFADELTRQGYNVVAVVDAQKQDHKTTEVIDRSKDDAMLRRLSQAVLRYVPGAQVGRARQIEGKALFTVIVGQDYATFIASGAGYGGALP